MSSRTVTNETVNHLFILFQVRCCAYLSNQTLGPRTLEKLPAPGRSLPSSQHSPSVLVPPPPSPRSWPGCRHQLVVVTITATAVIIIII